MRPAMAISTGTHLRMWAVLLQVLIMMLPIKEQNGTGLYRMCGLRMTGGRISLRCMTASLTTGRAFLLIMSEGRTQRNTEPRRMLLTGSGDIFLRPENFPV